jgi:hypothetical protein
MKHVQITKHITLTMTADDWELYGKDGREQAAEAINKGVADAINEGRLDKARAVLRKYSEYGASDSEGINTLENIVELFFNR